MLGDWAPNSISIFPFTMLSELKFYYWQLHSYFTAYDHRRLSENIHKELQQTNHRVVRIMARWS